MAPVSACTASGADSVCSGVMVLTVWLRYCGAPRQMDWIALAMGAAGVTSRVLNEHYTPVCHPLLASKVRAQAQCESTGTVCESTSRRYQCAHMPIGKVQIAGSSL